jgi:uncharacterized integral membrane protein
MEKKIAHNKKKQGFFISYSALGMIIGTALFLIFIAVFALQNTGNTAIRFLFFDFAVPTIALILVSVCIGILVCTVVYFLIKSTSKKKAHRQNISGL